MTEVNQTMLSAINLRAFRLSQSPLESHRTSLRRYLRLTPVIQQSTASQSATSNDNQQT